MGILLHARRPHGQRDDALPGCLGRRIWPARQAIFGACCGPEPGDSGRPYDSPAISPFSSMSIRSAAGLEPSPGIVRMSPQIG